MDILSSESALRFLEKHRLGLKFHNTGNHNNNNNNNNNSNHKKRREGSSSRVSKSKLKTPVEIRWRELLECLPSKSFVALKLKKHQTSLNISKGSAEQEGRKKDDSSSSGLDNNNNNNSDPSVDDDGAREEKAFEVVVGRLVRESRQNSSRKTTSRKKSSSRKRKASSCLTTREETFKLEEFSVDPEPSVRVRTIRLADVVRVHCVPLLVCILNVKFARSDDEDDPEPDEYIRESRAKRLQDSIRRMMESDKKQLEKYYQADDGMGQLSESDPGILLDGQVLSSDETADMFSVHLLFGGIFGDAAAKVFMKDLHNIMGVGNASSDPISCCRFVFQPHNVCRVPDYVIDCSFTRDDADEESSCSSSSSLTSSSSSSSRDFSEKKYFHLHASLALGIYATNDTDSKKCCCCFDSSDTSSDSENEEEEEEEEEEDDERRDEEQTSESCSDAEEKDGTKSKKRRKRGKIEVTEKDEKDKRPIKRFRLGSDKENAKLDKRESGGSGSGGGGDDDDHHHRKLSVSK